MDLSAYREIQRKNITPERLKRDLEYAAKVDELGLKAPNKIPTPLPMRGVQNQSQSNNPPSVKQPRGTLPKATIPKQLGIGFNQPAVKPQPLPYAKKVAQTLPRVDTQTLQKAQQVAKQPGDSNAMYYLTAGRSGIASGAAGLQNTFGMGKLSDIEKMDGQKTDFVKLGQNVSRDKKPKDNIATVANNIATNLTAFGDRTLPTLLRRWLTKNFVYSDEVARKKGYANKEEMIDAVVAKTLSADNWSDEIQQDFIELSEGKGNGQKLAASAIQAMGQLAVPIVSNMVLPGSGMYTMSGTVYGNSAMDALNQGATLQQAKNRGLLSAGAEYLTEQAFGGIPGLNKGLVNLGTGGNVIGEMLEEGAASRVSGAIDRATFNPEAEDPTWAETGWDALVGGLTSFGMNIPGMVANVANDIRSGEAYRADRGENEAAARMAGQLDRVYGANKLEGKAVLGEGKATPEAVLEQEQQASYDVAETPIEKALPKGNEIAPVSDNTSGGYENRVNELRESIKDLRRDRRKKVGGYSVGMYTRNGSEDITISIKTPDGEIIKDFVEGGKYWTNSQLQHEIASRIAEAEGYSAEEKQPAQPALPYNPNAPKPIPQNPAQGKFGGNMGIVANPEAVARAQERMDYFMPKPNPEGNRAFDGSVLDGLGQGQAAFAALDNLLAQSKLDAAKKPDAKEGIANVLTERPKKGVKENLEIAADFAARKLIDSGHTIDTIAKAVDDEVLYPLYNNAKQSRQAAEYMIGDAQTDINGKRVGDSLVSIFDPIKSKGEDYFRDFSTYLYHVHNVDRMSLETNGAQVYQDAIMQLEMENPMLQNATREEVEALASGNSDYREAAIEWLQLDDSLNDLHNKPVFGESVTAEDSRKAAAELARKNPEFAELAERVYAYNRNLMKYRVDAGLVSQNQADIMNALYPHYVPTFRDTSSTTGMKMGGNQAQVARTVRSATGSNLDLMPIDGSMAEQTLQTVRAAKMNIFGARLLEDALKHQDKAGRHIRSVVDKYNSYDMDEPPQYTGGVTIYSAGKPVSMDADVGVMEAFKSIQPDPLEGSNIYRRIVEANNTFKALVTGANPMFLAKNFARDLQDAGLYAGDLKDFAKNYPKAWKEIKNNGELWQLYKSQGGTGSSYFDYEKGLVDNKRKGVGKVFDKVEAANMMVEQAPRFAEFMSVLEKEGRTYEGIQKAMLAAADVTVNFGRSGTLTKTLNKTFVPFLNPSVQGADKFVRRFAQTKGAKEWLDLIGRCALLGIVPGLLNELLHRGTEEEEEYEMLNDRDKETNYVFSIGDGVWVKIPRGRAVSIFGSAAQRTARTLQGKEDAWAGFIELALDQVGTTDPFTGHILSSYLNTELFNPESPGKTWYGGDIEPQRLQGLPPGERYDEKTDNLSKWLGKQLNISPKKINHLLDSYTGVIGDFALPLMTPRAERNPFAAAFSIDSTTSNKLQGEFYDKLDELEQSKNSAEPTAGADLAYSYLNGVSREVSELNKQIRAIEADETIKGKDKREQTRKLAKERNNLIKEALEELPSYQEAAAGYKGDPDDAKREVNRKQFGAEYALKKYNKEVYENAQKANKYLIPYETFYDVYFAQKDLKSDKDSDGKTIKNSLSKKKKAAIDKTAKSLTQKQKEYLYDMFGVSKSEWNKLPTKT